MKGARTSYSHSYENELQSQQQVTVEVLYSYVVHLNNLKCVILSKETDVYDLQFLCATPIDFISCAAALIENRLSSGTIITILHLLPIALHTFPEKLFWFSGGWRVCSAGKQ